MMLNRILFSVVLLWMVASSAHAEDASADQDSPLRPPDRSSPAASLEAFLKAGDEISAFLADEYMHSPSHSKHQKLVELAGPLIGSLDLSETPPAIRPKAGRAAAAALYDTLNRIELPPFDSIPAMRAIQAGPQVERLRWVIPDTEIAIEQVMTGPHQGEFLFSTDTVSRAQEFYARVRDQPVLRDVPLESINEVVILGGGWMIPYRWVEGFPVGLRTTIGGQALWKWLALVLLTIGFLVFGRQVLKVQVVYRDKHPVLTALSQLVSPLFLLLATQLYGYLALWQINLVGTAGIFVESTIDALTFLWLAWLIWSLATVFSETIIASPRINRESIDAQLIRICIRLLALVGVTIVLAKGADQLGVPIYGIVAGLGVGGLAIALAAQPTIENLIGGLTLFADRPVRVGDFCQYGEALGTVESIGLRSTRVRGLDRTLTTIPNAIFSKMALINFTARDRILIRSTLDFRYETTPEQLRYLLARLRELLLSHSRIDPEAARVRFMGFGSISLQVELNAYVITRDWADYLAIREDIWLRTIDIVEESGTAFAFPSQTLYLSRDGGMDTNRRKVVEQEVRKWRSQGRLPFPDFSEAQQQLMKDSIGYPPRGACGQAIPEPDPEDQEQDDELMPKIPIKEQGN